MKQHYYLILFFGLYLLPGISKNLLLAAVQPTVAASNITVTNITNTTANITWTNGNGTGRIVLIQEKEDFIPYFFPQDGKTFSASATYKFGSNVGYKMYAIYIGSGNSVSISGLFNGTKYFITVLEYNGAGTDINYFQNPFPNRSFTTTGPTEPTVQSSGVTFSNVTNNTVDISWTNGNGERRIVLIQEKIDLVSYFFPKDGQQYSANSTYKMGTNVGYHMFAVYDGTGNSVSVNGLFNGTTYYVTVLDYNGTGIETNYILSPFPKGVVTTPGPTEPTIKPSQVTFSEKTETSVKVKWVNGNGERRVVLVRAKASTFDYFSPEDGKSYTANSTFGQGQYTGWVDTQDKRHYIVYNGSGNEFTLTGLQPFTEYYFSIVEYNGTGAAANYNRAIQTPSPVVKTLAPEPTVNATNLNFSNVTGNSMQVNWVNGNGSQRLLMVSTNPITNAYFPVDGQDYVANGVYGSGASLGYRVFAAYKGSGSSAVISGLATGTRYYVAVVEFNGTGTGVNYLSTGYLTGSQFTEGPRKPTVNASNLIINDVTENSLQLSWTNGNGSQRVVVASTNPINLAYFTNDGSDYNAGSSFGSGSLLGPNTYVMYEGTGSSVTLTGLSSGTNYYIAVVEFNGTGSLTKYLTTGFLEGSPFTEGPRKPSVSASNLVFNNVTNNSFQLIWTNGNGSQRVVVASTNPINLAYFTNDGSDYNASSSFGSGSLLGPSTYVMYEGTGSSVTLTGLSSGTNYYIAVVEFNGTGSLTKYLTTGFLNGSQFTEGPRKPSLNASNLVINNVTNNSFQLSWINGNGSQRVVVASTNPINIAYFTNDGSDYNASSSFGSGSLLGPSTYVMYEGTGSSVTLTGLSSGTVYYIAVVEFNGAGSLTKYLTTGFLKGSQLTTGAIRPTVNATNLSFANVNNSSMQVSWTNGNGAQRVVVASTNPINLAYFTNDGVDYTGNSNFGSGSLLGPNTYVMYEGTGSSVTFTGLLSGTLYYVAVVEFNGTGSEIKYLRSGFLTGTQLTNGPTRPTVNATNLIFSDVVNNSMRVSWTNGSGAQRVVVVSTGPFNMAYFTNDGGDYTANNSFGSGTILGSNTFVVYEGTGSSVNITGLSSGTTYYVGVVEFNGTGGETKYLRSGFLQGTQLTTGATRPTVNASNISFSNITGTGVKVDWINGNGARRLVIASNYPLQEPFLPKDGVDYIANANFFSGSHLGLNAHIMYKGTGSTVTITGLSPSTTYYIGVIEMNGEGDEIKYLKTNFVRGTITTTSGSTTSTSSTISNFTTTFSNQDASNLEEPIILNNYLEVYPNPASSYVNISLQLAEAVGSEMRIYSTQGKLIMVKQYAGNFQETLELDKLDKGIYIIKLVTETDHQVTKQLIIH